MTADPSESRTGRWFRFVAAIAAQETASLTQPLAESLHAFQTLQQIVIRRRGADPQRRAHVVRGGAHGASIISPRNLTRPRLGPNRHSARQTRTSSKSRASRWPPGPRSARNPPAEPGPEYRS